MNHYQALHAALATEILDQFSPIFFEVHVAEHQGQGHVLGARLYDGNGKVLREDLPRLALDGLLPDKIDYALDPLPPGRYQLAFDLLRDGIFRHAPQDESLRPIAFTIPEAVSSRGPGHSIYDVPPGNPLTLALECWRREDYALASTLAGACLAHRPDDAAGWDLWSRLRENQGDLVAAYDTAVAANGLTNGHDDMALRARLADLACQVNRRPLKPRDMGRARRPLHLVFAAPNLEPPRGGGEMTWQLLMSAAADRGHRVSVITDGPASAFAHVHAVRRWPNGPAAAQDPLLAEADVVCTQQDWTPAIVTAAKAANRPTAIFVQSYETVCRRPWMLSHCGRTGGRCSCPPQDTAAGIRALRQADMVLATSNYMASVVRVATGRDAEVFHQLVDLDALTPLFEAPVKAVVMNQPDEHKGGAVFEALAQRLTRDLFITVGYAERQRTRRPNLYHLGPIPGRLVFSLAEIFLIPSVWPEPFGRVALEALALGVPVVATRRGALEEVLGDAALYVDQPGDLDAWATCIHKLKSDPAFHAAQVDAGRKRSKRFEASAEARRLLNLLESLAG